MGRFHKHRYTSSRHRYTSSQTPVYEFTYTGIRVRRHRETSSPTKCMGSIRFREHRYTSSQTPVYEFADTGIRVQNTGIRVHRHRYTSSQTPEARVHLQFWVT